MTNEDILKRFSYVLIDDDKQGKIDKIKNMAIELALFINSSSADSREKSLALTELESSIMWANKAVSHN